MPFLWETSYWALSPLETQIWTVWKDPPTFLNCAESSYRFIVTDRHYLRVGATDAKVLSCKDLRDVFTVEIDPILPFVLNLVELSVVKNREPIQTDAGPQVPAPPPVV